MSLRWTAAVLDQGSGATQYTQDLTATATSATPVVARQPGLTRATTGAAAVVVTRQPRLTRTIAKVAGVTVIRQVRNNTLSVALTVSRALLRAIGLTKSTSTTPTASSTKRVQGAALAVTLIATSSATRLQARLQELSQACQTVSDVDRSVRVIKAITSTTVATLGAARFFFRVITTTVAQSATMARATVVQILKSITVSVAASPTLRRALSTSYALTVGKAASLTRSVKSTFTVSKTVSPVTRRQVGLPRQTSKTPTASVTRGVGKLIPSAQPLTALVTRATAFTVTTAEQVAGSVVREAQMLFNLDQPTFPTEQLRADKDFAATVVLSTTLTRRIAKLLVRATSALASLTSSIARQSHAPKRPRLSTQEPDGTSIMKKTRNRIMTED